MLNPCGRALSHRLCPLLAALVFHWCWFSAINNYQVQTFNLLQVGERLRSKSQTGQKECWDSGKKRQNFRNMGWLDGWGRGGDRNVKTKTSTQKFITLKKNHVENFHTPIINKPNANVKWLCRHNDSTAWKINHKLIWRKHKSNKDEFYMNASLPTFLA